MNEVWKDMLNSAGQTASIGATIGSVVPGVGTVIGGAAGGLLGVAMNMVPGLQHLIADKPETIQAVQSAVEAVTGTSDPVAAQAAVDADPEVVAELQRQLAKIANDRFKAALADIQNARAATLHLAQAGSPLSWGAPVVSVIVLASFGLLCGLLLFREIPPESEALLNILLGSLAAMTTSVVSYWVGSSAGSASKDARLSGMVPAALLPKPVEITSGQ